MDMKLKQDFMDRWTKYFPGVELPITFFYSDDQNRGESVPPPQGHRCVVSLLSIVRKGRNLCLGSEAVGCGGGKRYFGFAPEPVQNIEYFLSAGIPGKLEGERYKKSPETAREALARIPPMTAPAPYIVFKRWDLLERDDEPIAAIFFGQPDVLSGLFTLAGYDETDPNAVIAPFGAGCATIVHYPYLENRAEHPRAVIGMFDVSARPCVPREVLTFAVPMTKFSRMVADMDESFLITRSWDCVKSRFSSAASG